MTYIVYEKSTCTMFLSSNSIFVDGINIPKKTLTVSMLFITILLVIIPRSSFSQQAANTTIATSPCNCVVFRMDDIQDYWIESAQLAVMNLFISNHQGLTAGLIMHAVGNDSKIINKVREGYQKGLFELALHGWDHVDYTKLSEQEQKNSLYKANEKIQRLIGSKSDIFIPPYDVFDNTTLKAMGQVGIRILSSSLNDENSIDQKKSVFALVGKKTHDTVTSHDNMTIYHLPATISNDIYIGNKQIKNSFKNVIGNVSQAINSYGYAVVVLHPQDFVKLDSNGHLTNTLDQKQIKDLLNLINFLISKNIHTTSFSQVVRIGAA
jgi:peptidoglycan/xylan/chitin deacetylase (PgdA/CDA1 family)